MGLERIHITLFVFYLSFSFSHCIGKSGSVEFVNVPFFFVQYSSLGKRNDVQNHVKLNRNHNFRSIFYPVLDRNLVTETKGTKEGDRSTSKSQNYISSGRQASVERNRNLDKEKSFDKKQEEKDRIYMKLALKQAMHAFRNEEIPVGAVLVQNLAKTKELNLDRFVFNENVKEADQLEIENKSCAGTENNDVIVAACRNKVECRQDASAHAEMECLKQGSDILNRWRLSDCTLYVTLEPCTMCVGALQNYRIGRVVYATKSPLMGAVESYSQLLDKKHPFYDHVAVTGGVMEKEASSLLKRFFKQRRSQGAILNKKNQRIQNEIESDIHDETDYLGNFDNLI